MSLPRRHHSGGICIQSADRSRCKKVALLLFVRHTLDMETIAASYAPFSSF
jgi:hypothetical protein